MRDGSECKSGNMDSRSILRICIGSSSTTTTILRISSPSLPESEHSAFCNLSNRFCIDLTSTMKAAYASGRPPLFSADASVFFEADSEWPMVKERTTTSVDNTSHAAVIGRCRATSTWRTRHVSAFYHSYRGLQRSLIRDLLTTVCLQLGFHTFSTV